VFFSYFIELDVIRKQKESNVDRNVFATQVKETFENQIFRLNQKLVTRFQGELFSMKVVDIETDGYGMLTRKTNVTLAKAGASGIRFME
jgi:hypothetical protein